MVSLLRYCRISAQSVELQPEASGEYLGALVFPRFIRFFGGKCAGMKKDPAQ